MTIVEKKGHLSAFEINNREIDILPIEWHEAGKRILHKRTRAGKEISIRFLGAPQPLIPGDILFADETAVVAVEIIPCEALAIRPRNNHELAGICYEIGNKHLPLFTDGDELLVEYDPTLYKMLTEQGYVVTKEQRVLSKPLRSSVTPHGHGKETLLTKLIKLSGT